MADLDFSSYHNKPSAPTNLTLHQALDINVPIGCGDVAVFPGDIILGDDDGIMVIPSHLIDEVVEECTKMTLFEEFVMQQVKNGKPIVGLYPLTDDKIKSEFEAWRASKA